MRSWMKTIVLAFAAALIFTFPVLAGQWRQDMNGWWYENDDGTYLKNGWHWVDGDRDGWAECYYFGKDGYILKENGHVDGYEVNEDGAWIVDGVVQRMVVSAPEGGSDFDRMGLTMEEKAYWSALNKNYMMDDLNMNYRGAYSISDGLETYSLDILFTLKAHELSGSDPKFCIKSEVAILDEKRYATMFYTDGILYGENEYERIKEAMEGDELQETVREAMSVIMEPGSLEYGASIFESDGGKIIFYTVDPEDIGGMMGDMLPNYYEEDSRVSKSEGKVVIDRDGYLVSAETHVEMQIFDEEELFTISLDSELNFNQPGQPVTVEIPSTERYEEI